MAPRSLGFSPWLLDPIVWTFSKAEARREVKLFMAAKKAERERQSEKEKERLRERDSQGRPIPFKNTPLTSSS